jgi:hypothetical protein
MDIIQAGERSRNSLHEIAKDIFGFDMETYLLENKRKLWGITIETKSYEHHALFGDPDPSFLKEASELYRKAGDKYNAEAGYKVNVGKIPSFSHLNINADVFLINPERLKNNISNLTALLIHELCHMVIESELIKDIPLKIDKEAMQCGEEIYNKTDKLNENVTKHYLVFCQILAIASHKTQFIYNRLYTDKWDVIKRAMRHGDIVFD